MLLFAVLGEDFLAPTPPLVSFESLTTTHLQVRCSTVGIIDDNDYEGLHAFVARFGDLAEPHIITGDAATIVINDNGNRNNQFERFME